MEVFTIGSRQNAIPVVRKTKHLQLACEGSDVGFGARPGGRVRRNGVFFRRQTESVVSHRVEDVDTAHSGVSSHNIGSGVTFRMPYVQTGATGIGKHVQHVKLLGSG